jgi:hypothetical protein
MPIEPARPGAERTWMQIAPLPIAVDHLGIVVHDLDREVARWRDLGFLVSPPVPLMAADGQGASRPLGQKSAHAVFANGYIELSSPDPGSGNHLEPYLALGEGVRILVHAADDVDAAWHDVARRWPTTAMPREAARSVGIDGATETARFRWFPLVEGTLPGVLSAVVQHLTPELVFQAAFARHPNGLRRMDWIGAVGSVGGIVDPRISAGEGRRWVPLRLMATSGSLRIAAFGASGDNGTSPRVFAI